jgi:IS5 family transposase
MFKVLIHSIWYDLSDVKLAGALDDRASFRRFCGFSGTEVTPGAYGLRQISQAAGRAQA